MPKKAKMENMKIKSSAATAKKRGEMKSSDSLFDCCKLGWNRRFIFPDDVSSDGSSVTIVTAKLMWRGKYELCHDVLSGYVYGGGWREDKIVDAIREAVDDFLWYARELGLMVKGISDRSWFGKIGAGVLLDSDAVRHFAASLASLPRVFVEIKAKGGRANA